MIERTKKDLQHIMWNRDKIKQKKDQRRGNQINIWKHRWTDWNPKYQTSRKKELFKPQHVGQCERRWARLVTKAAIEQKNGRMGRCVR